MSAVGMRERHRQVLRYLDLIFGSYCVAMAAAAVLAWRAELVYSKDCRRPARLRARERRHQQHLQPIEAPGGGRTLAHGGR